MQKLQENGKFIKLYRLDTYILILFHIFIVLNAFYNMKLKIYKFNGYSVSTQIVPSD